MTIATESVAARTLVPEELFDRLTNRIAAEEGLPRVFAARIMDQALAFLSACAADRASRLSPSPLVDIGWHTFILHTQEYAEFCGRVAGGYIHHVPNDGLGDHDSGVANRHAELACSVSAIVSAGLRVDPDLWTIEAASCTSGDDGCRASGKDGNENTDTNGR
ncbi:hypothetical protein OG439_03370 [Amycolatopsis sp. NBC_01307]|uniref:glycine-rich domain-containing protein n=1 Tax=Amycolatopsis sp. NBC_01307 TaxID=2903561 RepID=UPI002E0F09B8|nr:hypothetical protein OG439_03370 [Amycolatopsis sp. NBC_01307]